MSTNYTDPYIDYIIHDLDNIFNVLVIAIQNFVDPEDVHLRTLAGVALNTCAELSLNVRRHYSIKTDKQGGGSLI